MGNTGRFILTGGSVSALEQRATEGLGSAPRLRDEVQRRCRYGRPDRDRSLLAAISAEAKMSGWGCPNELKGVCLRVKGRNCDPGMKGCVLHGRFVFSNPAKNPPPKRTVLPAAPRPPGGIAASGE